MPEDLEYWTADEVAECLPYQPWLVDRGNALYRKLWGFLVEAENAGTATPLGGDGADGTVEYPCGRQNLENTDKARHWWARLDPAEQRAVALAYRSEFGGEA
jgi:hypothetical protein